MLTEQGEFPYGKLVLATGASAVRPDLPGSEHLVTLNSQQEYRRHRGATAPGPPHPGAGGGAHRLRAGDGHGERRKRGDAGGSGRQPLSALLPAALTEPLQQALRSQGVSLQFGTGLARIDAQPGDGWRVTLTDGRISEQDLVIAAIGLRPNLALARGAGLAVERGILVDDRLQTSDPHIFALGDCVQWQGQLLPFLQPIVLGANALARTLLGTPTPLALPPMLVKVKTPRYPLQLAGRTRGEDLAWQCRWNSHGMVAEAHGEDGKLCGFVVGGDQMSAAFPLLRQLPR